MSLLILGHVVVTVLAFRTFQSNSCAHNFHLAFYLFTYVLLMVAKPSIFRHKKKDLLPFAVVVYHGGREEVKVFVSFYQIFSKTKCIKYLA